jgi:hypothetical protein
MLRERSEIVNFSRDDIERIVRYIAKQQLAGTYVGKFGEQTARWLADGSIEVSTTIQEGDLADIPPSPIAQTAMAEIESPRKKKHK